MQEDLRKIHEASISILGKTGVEFYHPEVLELIEQKGVKIVGNTAFFTEEQIMLWIGKAPGSFKVHARNSQYDILIGGDLTEFAAGYGAPTIIESDGTRRRALFSDYINFLKLVHQSDYFKVNGGVLVQPADLGTTDSYPIMLYAALIHSDKCLMGGAGGAKEAQQVMDTLGIVFGGKESLAEKPRIMTIINSTSPLRFDETTLETMLVYARHGQPLIVTPATMAGTTGPVTLAGTIALANAEILAGIAVTQMIREGVPVVYGFQATTADLKTGNIAIGSPECALCVTYGARLAKAYGLPCRGGGTNTDAKCVSVQSGYESMLVMLAACQEKMNLIIHSAGILDSHAAMSYEQFIVDLEIIGMIKRFIAGLKVDANTLAVEVIDQVGPGGEFLTAAHTMEFCRKEPWIPGISIRSVLHGENPNERILANINNKRNEMIVHYQKPELSSAINAKLIDYLGSIGLEMPSI